MNMLNNMKIGTKILGGYLVAILVTMVIGYLGYDGIHVVDTALDDIAENNLPSVNAIQTINEAHSAVLCAESAPGQRSPCRPSPQGWTAGRQYRQEDGDGPPGHGRDRGVRLPG